MSEIEVQPAAPSPTAVRDRLIVLGLILITLACYWPVGTADFVNYDDNRYITDNPTVQRGLTMEGIKYAFTSPDGGYWHPITWISHMIDVELYGPKETGRHLVGVLLRTNDTLPGGHHFTNLIFHVANTLLLLAVMKRLTGTLWPSVWVAAMFAVHPMHVESVAWVAERKDVLSGLFFLLTILAYHRYTQKPDVPKYLLVVAAFIGALMCKPTTMTLPCVLLLLDVWPLNRIVIGPGFGRTLVRPVLEKLPMLLLSVGSGVISIYGTKSLNSFHSLESLPLGLRLQTSIISYARYLGKLVWPTNLAVFYPYPTSWPMAAVVGSTVLVLVITALAIWQFKRRPFVLVGWLWFLGMLVPMIGLVATGDASLSDRYTYLPYIGIFIMLAWLATEMFPKRGEQWGAVGAGVVLVCIVLSYRQTTIWRNSETLMSHAIRTTTDNWIAETNLGATLADARKESAGDHFKEAVRLRPQGITQNVNYARWLIGQNEIEEASKYILRAGKIDPADPDYLVCVARVQGLKGRHNAAVTIFNHVLSRKPRSFEAEMYLANSLLALGRIDEAEDHLRRAIKINPSLDMAYYHLGKIAALRRNPTEAIANFQRSIALAPMQGASHLDYAITLASLGRYDESMGELMAANEYLDKEKQLTELSITEHRMGQVLEKLNQPLEAAQHFVKAIDFAKQAVAKSPTEPSAHYQLAVTLKQLGDPAEAKAAATKAMDVAADAGNRYFIGQLLREFPDLTPPATRPTTVPASLPGIKYVQ